MPCGFTSMRAKKQNKTKTKKAKQNLEKQTKRIVAIEEGGMKHGYSVGWSRCKIENVKSLCCTSETNITNIILYMNLTFKKWFWEKENSEYLNVYISMVSTIS